MIGNETNLVHGLPLLVHTKVPTESIVEAEFAASLN